MYALDGNNLFPIYWMDNPLPVFGFDNEKLDALEVHNLAILDVFRVIKVWDLMNIVDD